MEKMNDRVSFKNIPWKLTDPDSHQYGRQISEMIFQFKEFNRNDYNYETLSNNPEIESIFHDDKYWIIDGIDLNGYQYKEIELYINPYGYTTSKYKPQDNKGLQYIYELYGKDSSFIIAECIFEQTNDLY